MGDETHQLAVVNLDWDHVSVSKFFNIKYIRLRYRFEIEYPTLPKEDQKKRGREKE